MRALDYTIIESSNYNADIVVVLDNLYGHVKQEWDLWAVKPNSKTSFYLTSVKSTLEVIREFIKEDNINAVYLLMKKSKLDHNMIKKCFRGKKKLQKITLRIWSELLDKLIQNNH